MAKVKIQYIKEPLTGFEEFAKGVMIFIIAILSFGVSYYVGLAVYDTIEMHDKLLNKSENIEKQTTIPIPLPLPEIPGTQGTASHICVLDKEGNVYCK